jgi:hypothetical protein
VLLFSMHRKLNQEYTFELEKQGPILNFREGMYLTDATYSTPYIDSIILNSVKWIMVTCKLEPAKEKMK